MLPVALQKGESELTIVDYNIEWAANKAERELDRKRVRAARFMQRIYRCDYD
jgi:hypothetical protein